MRRLAAALVLLVVAATAAIAAVSRLEERDSFCIACHLAPEISYVEQAADARIVDDPFLLPNLASYHYWQAAQDATKTPFRCIDCHRGDGRAAHRLRVLGLAAADTLTWALGRADETVAKGDVPNVPPGSGPWQGPAHFSRAPDVLNDGCLHCHQPTLTLVGFDNHFHNRLPAARRAYEQTGALTYPDDWPQGVDTERLLPADETILSCLDCHRAHVPGFEIDYFLEADRVVLPACEQCHAETERGPLDLID